MKKRARVTIVDGDSRVDIDIRITRPTSRLFGRMELNRMTRQVANTVAHSLVGVTLIRAQYDNTRVSV